MTDKTERAVPAESIGVGLLPDGRGILLSLLCSMGGRPHRVGAVLSNADAIALAEDLRVMATSLTGLDTPSRDKAN